MSASDMENLARRIVSLEKRHNTSARSAQLPNSSVVLADGTIGDISQATEATYDNTYDISALGEYGDDIGTNIDFEAIYKVEIPEWVYNIGSAVDMNVEDTQFAIELSNRIDEDLAQANLDIEQAQLDITAATSTANQAASDAFQASVEAAAADSKAQSALDTLQNTVALSIIEYAVGDSETVAPTTGWSTDNPEPAEGEFVWMRTVVTYVDETVYTSDPVLMSRGGGGGGEPVKIDSLTTYYTATTSEPTIQVPDLPTDIEPPLGQPWWPQPPAYPQHIDTQVLFTTERIIYTDGSFMYSEPKLSHEWRNAGEAAKQAEAAKYLAEGIYTTIPSITEPAARANGSPLVQGDLWYKQGSGDTAGQFIGVGVWNGTAWQDRQLVADSILVPSSVGTTLIADNAITTGKIMAESITGDKLVANTITGDKIVANAITADKLEAHAIDGMTITGALIQGGELALYSVADSVTTFTEDFEGTVKLNDGGYPLATTTTYSLSGTKSAVIPYKTSGYAYAKLWPNVDVDIPVQANKPYLTFSAWVYSTTSRVVRFAPSSWVGPEFTRSEREIAANTWTLMSADVELPEEPEAHEFYENPGFEFYGIGPGDLYVDDIKVEGSDLRNESLRIYRNPQGNVNMVAAAGNGRVVSIVPGEIQLAAADGHAARIFQQEDNSVTTLSETIFQSTTSLILDTPTVRSRKSLYVEPDPGDGSEQSIGVLRTYNFTHRDLRMYSPASDTPELALILRENGTVMSRFRFRHDGNMYMQTYTGSPTATGTRMLPFAQAAGYVSARNVGAGASVKVAVTFPGSRFTTVPAVVATVVGNARDTTVNVTDTSATSVSVNLGSMSTVTRSIGAFWQAIQMSSTSRSG